METIFNILAQVTDNGRSFMDFIAVAGGILAAIGVGRKWIKDILGITENERRSLQNLMYNEYIPDAHRIQAAEQYIKAGHDNPIATAYAEKLVKDHGGHSAAEDKEDG